MHIQYFVWRNLKESNISKVSWKKAWGNPKTLSVTLWCQQVKIISTPSMKAMTASTKLIYKLNLRLTGLPYLFLFFFQQRKIIFLIVWKFIVISFSLSGKSFASWFRQNTRCPGIPCSKFRWCSAFSKYQFKISGGYCLYHAEKSCELLLSWV